MNDFQLDIDERSQLTTLNKLELLLFRLGGDAEGAHAELYGITMSSKFAKSSSCHP